MPWYDAGSLHRPRISRAAPFLVVLSILATVLVIGPWTGRADAQVNPAPPTTSFTGVNLVTFDYTVTTRGKQVNNYQTQEAGFVFLSLDDRQVSVLRRCLLDQPPFASWRHNRHLCSVLVRRSGEIRCRADDQRKPA